MTSEEQRRNTIVCPGCGGRNDAAARECEWCGRLFVAERRQLDARWLAPAAAGGIVVLMLSVIAFALVGSRSAPRQSSQTPTPVVTLSAPDEEEPEEPTHAATPRPSPTSTLQAAVAPEPPSVEYVRIANTGGVGAFIRREARAGSPGIVAYRDGTILKVVGPDVTADNRVWRQVEDRQGIRGWTPREFLEPSPTGF